MGREVSYTFWKDENGRYLKDFFPTLYTLSGVNGSQKLNVLESLKKSKPQVRVFYIRRNSGFGRECNASGFYDMKGDKFILKAGSVLSLGASPAYNYSAQGAQRISFLSEFCSKTPKGYVLKSDHVFDFPSAAASYVLGRPANGWKEWKDENNITLDSVYR